MVSRRGTQRRPPGTIRYGPRPHPSGRLGPRAALAVLREEDPRVGKEEELVRRGAARVLLVRADSGSVPWK